jgi:hypothetical protein
MKKNTEFVDTHNEAAGVNDANSGRCFEDAAISGRNLLIIWHWNDPDRHVFNTDSISSDQAAEYG